MQLNALVLMLLSGGLNNKDMNKLVKLSDTHYIVVDDSEIKEGYVFNGAEIFLREEMSEYSDEYVNRYWEKITHSTQPLEPSLRSDDNTLKDFVFIKPLSLSEVEEAINSQT